MIRLSRDCVTTIGGVNLLDHQLEELIKIQQKLKVTSLNALDVASLV